MLRINLLVLIILLFLPLTSSSAGDSDPAFRNCVQQCTLKRNCIKNTASSSAKSSSVVYETHEYNDDENESWIYKPLHVSVPIPKSLSSWWSPWNFYYYNVLTFPNWSCPEKCSYYCMSSITKQRKSMGYGELKYFGHWPFIRYFALEEPASVVFSLLNAWPHVVYILKRLRIFGYGHHGNRYGFKYLVDPSTSSLRDKGDDSYISVDCFMSIWLDFLPYVSLAAWLASAYFHAQKTPFSSLVDYICALCLIAYRCLFKFNNTL